MAIVPEKRQLSLSIEPLLLNEPYEPTTTVVPANGVPKDGKHVRAAFKFIRILFTLLVILIAIQFFIRFFPLLLASIHAVASSFRQYERKAEGLFEKELPEIVQQFKAFEEEFERVWANQSERWHRYKVFETNLHQIGLLNFEAKRAGKNVTFGVNGMVDRTEEELRQMLLPLDHFKKRRQNAKFIRQMSPELQKMLKDLSGEQFKQYPGHYDWRDHGVVTPVKAQGLCGSCWAFAAVATTESAYAVAHGELRVLSEQELLDCDLANNACNGGSEDKAFNFIHERGLVSGLEYPYVAHRQNTCRMDEGSKNLTKIDVAVFLNPDEDSMLDWLLNFGPVNVGISVPPDMKPYTGGLYHPSDFDCKFRVLGLHALLVVGYGVSEDGEKYWIVKNSWGDTWGQEHGYVNFARGVNACGIEDEPIGLLA